MTAAGRPRSDAARTRERLLDAAEHLIASHGVQALSLRAVNAAAGARNVAAAHYHFGSKEGLVTAVAARGMEALALARLAALDAVTARSRDAPPDLRALVEAMVLPLAHLPVDDRRAATYVTALARIATEPGTSLDRIAPPTFWTMVARLAALLRDALPELPERVLYMRIRYLFQQTFVMVAELQRMVAVGGGELRRRDVDVIATDLVDYLIGGLAGPSRSPAEPPPAPVHRPGLEPSARAHGARLRRR